MYLPSQMEDRQRIGKYAVNDAITISNKNAVGYRWDIQEGMLETTVTSVDKYGDGGVSTEHRLHTSLLLIFE